MEPQPAATVTFVVAVNDHRIFAANFLASTCLRPSHQMLVQENFPSASKAYNDAIDRSVSDLLVFCHQDVLLPETWLPEVQEAIRYLDVHDPNWGVLGCSGITRDRRHWRYLYSSGLGVSGEPLVRPEPVQTLDEVVLILRRSSGLRFDEYLPSYHLYGTDICLRAMASGRRAYAISAFCIHNTHQSLVLPKDFYKGCAHIKKVWRHHLPIQTTCIRLTRSNLPVYLRRAQEFYLRYIRGKTVGGTRVEDGRRLLEDSLLKS